MPHTESPERAGYFGYFIYEMIRFIVLNVEFFKAHTFYGAAQSLEGET